MGRDAGIYWQPLIQAGWNYLQLSQETELSKPAFRTGYCDVSFIHMKVRALRREALMRIVWRVRDSNCKKFLRMKVIALRREAIKIMWRYSDNGMHA